MAKKSTSLAPPSLVAEMSDETEMVSVSKDELELYKVTAQAYDDLVKLLPALKPQNILKFKSVPDADKAQAMSAWLLESTILLLRGELEHSPPETRNRMTVAVDFADERWNLTLARGDFEHAVEAQRNQARTERDHWRDRFFEVCPLQLPPTDEATDGNDATDPQRTQEG